MAMMWHWTESSVPEPKWFSDHAPLLIDYDYAT
jgi:hypothetical protein